MKKILFLLVFVLLGVVNVQAQSVKKDTVVKKIKTFTFDDVQDITEDFRFGLHLSPTTGTFSSDAPLNNDGGVFRWSGGIIMDKYLFGKDRYAFSTGLNFTRKGGTFNSFEDFELTKLAPGDTIAAGTNVKMKLNYVEIPLILRLRTNPIQNVFVGYGHFGWNNGIRTKSRGVISGEEMNFRKAVRFFNFSITYGIGVEYKLGENSTAMVGLNFNKGLTNVMKNIEGAESNANFDEANLNADHVALQFGIFF